MLQILKDQRLLYLTARIKELDLEFPVAILSEKTKISAGYISEMLNKKKGVSDKFFKKFIAEFGELKENFEDVKKRETLNNSILKEQSSNFYEENSKKDKKNNSLTHLTTQSQTMEAIIKLIDNNKEMVETNKMLAQGTLTLIDSNKQLIDEHSRLVSESQDLRQMLKEKEHINSNVQDEIPLAVSSAMNRMIQAFSTKFGGEKADELSGEIYNFVYDTPMNRKVADNRRNADILNKG